MYYYVVCTCNQLAVYIENIRLVSAKMVSAKMVLEQVVFAWLVMEIWEQVVVLVSEVTTALERFSLELELVGLRLAVVD